MENLANEGKIADALLLAWSIIEMNLDGAFLYAYHIAGPDPRSDPLLEMRIVDKIRLQKTLGHLTGEEADAILKFKKERDTLFHRGGLFFPSLQKEEKTRLVRLAIDATDASHALYRRAGRS